MGRFYQNTCNSDNNQNQTNQSKIKNKINNKKDVLNDIDLNTEIK